MVFIGAQQPLRTKRNGYNGMVAATEQVTRKRDCAAQRPYARVAPSSTGDCFVEPNL
jgi:hypothetical protein